MGMELIIFFISSMNLCSHSKIANIFLLILDLADHNEMELKTCLKFVLSLILFPLRALKIVFMMGF